AAPDLIDHATLGVAPWGRHGWGAALLMRDVSDELVPVGDAPIEEGQHLAFLEHCTGLAARLWGWSDDRATPAFLPHAARGAWSSQAGLDGGRNLGYPEPVPRLAAEGWARFAVRAPGDVAATVDALRRDARPLWAAVATTPTTFLHG